VWTVVALGRFDVITGIGEETTCSSEQAVAVMSHPYERGRDVQPLFFVAPGAPATVENHPPC